MRNVESKFPLILAMFMMIMFVSCHAYHAQGYWDDLATENTVMKFSGAGQNGNSVVAFSLVEPIPTGWLGIYASRQVADEMLISEIIAAHIQGGFDIKRFGIEGYITASRDKWQAIDLAVEVGYFGRLPSVQVGWLEFSSGGGNWSERRDNDTEIGRDAAETSASFGWLAFLSARLKTRFGEASSTARYKPSLDFKDTRIELLGSLNKEISDAWQFGVSMLTEFDSDSIVDSDIHSSYLISFTYTPE